MQRNKEAYDVIAADDAGTPDNSTLPTYSRVVSFHSSDLAGQTVVVLAQGIQADEADFYLIVY